jgi:hypothetical protein
MWKVNQHAKQVTFKTILRTLIPEEESSLPCYFYPQPDYQLIYKEVLDYKYGTNKPSLLLSSSPSEYKKVPFSLAHVKSALNYIEDAEYIIESPPQTLIQPKRMEHSKMHYLLGFIIIFLVIIYVMQKGPELFWRTLISCTISLGIVYVLFFRCHII